MHENMHAMVSDLDDQIRHKDKVLLDLRKQMQLVIEQNAALKFKADRVEAENATLQSLLSKVRPDCPKNTYHVSLIAMRCALVTIALKAHCYRRKKKLPSIRNMQYGAVTALICFCFQCLLTECCKFSK